MEIPTSSAKKIGHKIEQIRKLKGINQEALAQELGISRQSVSRIEQGDELDEEKLEQIASALGVSVDTIKNFSEDAAIFQIQNMHDNAQAIYQYNFNPIEKIVELYEALLKSEREKTELLKTLLDKK